MFTVFSTILSKAVACDFKDLAANRNIKAASGNAAA